MNYITEFQTIVKASPTVMSALTAANTLSLSSWCLGAGVVRNLVWDYLHGYERATPLEDVDLVYFDSGKSIEHQNRLQAALSDLNPQLNWDVTNQAHVHTWYAQRFGYPVHPLQSLDEGIASWPEYATCVGVNLDDKGRINILAPYGLDDLFNLRVRHNPARASSKEFRSRHTSKRWKQRWPKLMIM